MIRNTSARARGNRRGSEGTRKKKTLAANYWLAPFIHAVVNLAGIKVKYEISRSSTESRAANVSITEEPCVFLEEIRSPLPPFSTCKLECMTRPRTRKEEKEDGK